MKRLFSMVIATACLASPPAPALHAQHARPKLVVLIAVDQMRADYPERYAALFSKGLKRLTTEGAWFTQAAYPYLDTFTCVGHHTIGTGTFPYQHGMIDNAWFDRGTQKMITCTADPDSTNAGPAGPVGGVGDSDARNKMPSLADIMRKDLGSRVVALSLKARAAIGLAGHGGDAVIWLGTNGAPETSSAYSPAAGMTWASAFAKADPVSRDEGKTWERSLPADAYQYPDDGVGEKPGNGWKATFPHALGSAGDRTFIAHWEESPFGDAYLESMAESALDEFKLGQEDRTDFLGISFSSLDFVGHAFGPRSEEVEDTVVRLDGTLGKLLDALDNKVGRDNYVLALSADHGVADVPEQVPGGGRVLPPTVTAAVEGALEPFFGQGPFVAANLGTDLYFEPGVYAKVAANPKALTAVRAAILKVPGVARVFTTAEVQAHGTRRSKDPLLRAAALSDYPGRTGDLLIITKPNVIFGNATATHGSPYAYDQRVPVIFFGAGVKPGPRSTAATPADIAATMASFVGVKLPSPDGHVLAVGQAHSATKPAGR